MSQEEKPVPSIQKSKLDLLEESLSSIIDDISFSSHSAAVLEPVSKLPSTAQQPPLNPIIKLDTNLHHSTLNLETPIQSEFADEYSTTKLTQQISISYTNLNNNIPSFEQLLNNTGYSSYINDFHQTGVMSLNDLIRFATQYLPPSLNVTPAPYTHTQSDSTTPTPFPYPKNKQIKFTANDNENKVEHDEKKYEHETENEEQKSENINIASEEKRNARSNSPKKRKLRLYEVGELLGDDEYCEYALLIRDGGNNSINGYYTCSGKKNEHYMFNHMNDNKAALYCAKNGTWMIVYDDELLYGNPLKYDSVGGRDILLLSGLNLYPPPPRCWYAIEGVNPPPGVMWIEITDDPMAFVDEDMAVRLKEKNMNEAYMNKLKVDLPVQMIDFMFCGPIGFALRIDDDTKVMDVIRIKHDGQAKELGLKHGDTLLKINEEDVSKMPNVAFPMLKECVQSDVAFEVTFLRKKYDELVINVQRAGSPECNGKYVFLTLDEFDAPVFVKDNDMETWRILRLDHDDQDGQSIWGIQNMKLMNEYYIGISNSYAPPNNTWETIEEVGKNPAPGLQFIAVDDNVMRKLVPDGPKIRQNIFTATKRKRVKNGYNHKDDDDNMIDDNYQFGQDDDANNEVIVSLNSFKMEILGQKQTKEKDIGNSNNILQGPLGNEDRKDDGQSVRKVSFNPSNLAKHTAMMSSNNNNNANNATPFHFNRSDSIMSTKSVYAVPDEVTNALSEYQKQICDLEKELKTERKRALTLSHKHKTQESFFKQHEEKLSVEKENMNGKIEWFRDELYTVNHSYYELWIKQSDIALEHRKISKGNHKTQAKFSQTKKQLFQAKRKIEDLQDEIEILEEELENEKLKVGHNKEDELFLSSDMINNNLEVIEMQTDIALLKANLAKKDIEIDELKMDNDQWQEAHDSIFERMTEAQTRLAKEIDEFEDAKKFYENKLSILRDRIQDNSIYFWEYEKRLNEINKIYENESGKKLGEWKNKPNIKYDTSENKRVSITFGNNNSLNRNKNNRDSMISMSGGWGQLSPHPSNNNNNNNNNYNNYREDNILYDEDEDEMDSDDNNNAFGAFTATIYHDDDDDEFECEEEEEEEDGTNAFGTID